MHRMYENEDMVVFWNSDKCIHAKRLVYKLLEEAERNCVDVTATCSYAMKVLEE